MFDLRSLSVLILFPLLTQCQYSGESNQEVAILNIDTKKQEIVLSEIFDANGLSYIPLETTEANQIGYISQVVFQKDRIYVLDGFVKKALFVFDLKGTFLFQVGNLGKGIGEYGRPSCFQVSSLSNHIIILDSEGKKFLTFDRDGIFQDESKINYQIFSFTLDQSDLLVVDRSNEPIPSGDSYSLFSVDMEGNVVSRAIPIPEALLKMSATSNKVFSIQKTGISYLSSFQGLIYGEDGDDMKPKYKLDYGFASTEMSYFSKFNDAGELLMDMYSNNYPAFPEYLGTDKFIYLKFQIGRIGDGYQSQFIHNKKSKKSIVFSHYTDDIKVGGLNIVATYDNNTFISALNAISLIDKVKEDSSYLNNEQLATVLSDLKEGDNPVLLKMKIKNDFGLDQ